MLSAAMGLLPVVPPEHVHAGEEHGHAHVVLHRHLKSHAALEHRALHQPAVDDDDGPVLTLTETYTVPGTIVLAVPPRTPFVPLEAPPLCRDERLRPELT